MNIREDLGRFLNETEQVMRTRRYKWLCSIALILSIAGIFHPFDGDFWKVRRLQRDIEEVAPQWEAFKRTNPGFDSIVFFASRDEAHGAKLKARGTLSSSREKQLYEFVASTKLSPYPFDTLNVRFSLELEYGPTTEELERRIKGGKLNRLQNGSEPVGAANGSQPIRPETNPTSSAGWPRRCFERLGSEATRGLTEVLRLRETVLIASLLFLRHPDIQTAGWHRLPLWATGAAQPKEVLMPRG